MSNPQADTIRRLGAISREYEQRANAYETIAIDASRAEAEYRRVHAVAKLKAMHDGASAAKADAIANADPEVSQACMAYKHGAAVADAAAKKLIQMRSQLDYGRSVLTSEREADRIHSSGIGGAA